MKVTVVGLGKLGAPLAAVIASAGHDVLGIDLNPGAVAAVGARVAPVAEPLLQETMDAIDWEEHPMTAQTTYGGVEDTDISMIVVPTPSGADSRFDHAFVQMAVENISLCLRGSKKFHCIVVCSTLMPGTTGGILKPTIEKLSGKMVGQDVGLCYSPEFIALGSVIHDMKNPDVVLMGADDDRSRKLLEALVKSYVENSPLYRSLSLVNAEIAKIAVNAYITMKISFANNLSEIVEAVPGGDTQQILNAIGGDPRIGHKYLSSGAPFGGECFPRDSRAFAAFARERGGVADLALATDIINRRQFNRLLPTLDKFAQNGGGISVLGLAFKPGTAVTTESLGMQIASYLGKKYGDVRVHDPLAVVALEGVVQVETIADALVGARLVVIATPWEDYKRFGTTATVIDCWNITREDSNIIRWGKNAS